MNLLNDTTLFVAIVQQGGFSHAAKHLGLSSGLVSRRLAKLEQELGVTLIQRTTRQFNLTAEGKIFYEHALKIQQEFDTGVALIKASTIKAKGLLRISAPTYFGRHYLTPILNKFMAYMSDVHIDLTLSNAYLDPVRENFDLIIRGAGYLEHPYLEDSTLKVRQLLKETVKLYAHPQYLSKFGNPQQVNELAHHAIIHFTKSNRIAKKIKYQYWYQKKKQHILLLPKFSSNDIEVNLITCSKGFGIGKFTYLNAHNYLKQQLLQPVLNNYDWGYYQLFIIYPKQEKLPTRTRLLLDFIVNECQELQRAE
jgi:LysR family transcriptional activator of dmlA